MTIVAALSLPLPAAATVYEYGPGGEVVIDGRRQSEAQAASKRDQGGSISNKSARSYRDLAHRIALRHASSRGPRQAGLDVLTFARLFTELVRVESAFDPEAVSPKGAQGLGQLMPVTARRLGVTDPFDPVQNLDGAARYFCAQLARFGDARLALAAYNAGPQRVVQHGGIPPFRETRTYVSRIAAAVGLAPRADRAPAAPAAVPPSSESRSQGNQSAWDQ